MDESEPQIGVRIALECGRSHADNDMRFALEQDALAYHGWISIERRSPESVAENHQCRTAGDVFVNGKLATHRERHAEDAEIAGADALRLDADRARRRHETDRR